MFCFFPPLPRSLSVSTAPPPPFRNIDATKKYWNKRNNFLEALLKLHLVRERSLVVNLPGWRRRGEGAGWRRGRCSRSRRMTRWLPKSTKGTTPGKDDRRSLKPGAWTRSLRHEQFW